MAAFALVAQRPGTSIATIRSTKLLQPMLPLICSIAAANYARPRSKRKEKEFWVQLLTPCHLIQEAANGVGLYMLDHDANDLMNKILQTLELMFDPSLSPNNGEFAASEYPRMETVRKKYLECDRDEDKETLIRSVNFIQPGTTEDCERLTSHLSQLVKLVQVEAETPVPDASSVIVKQRRLLSPILSNMFTTMSKFLGCTTNQVQHQHQAALPLFTHRVRSPEDDSIVFTILFSISHRLHQWREASITVENRPLKPTRVRFIAPTDTKARLDTSKAAKMEITNLCGVINGTELSRLNLGIEGNSLFRASAEQLHPGLDSGEMVSLADGILISEQSKLSFKARICVALVLSYSFIDFCGDSWFPQGWSRDSIYLMQRNGRLSLRPHLQTQIKSTVRHIKDKANDTLEIRLLHHGQLLMEIFFQEPLEMSVSSKENLDVLRQEVRDHFDDRSIESWDYHEQFRQAVQTCVMSGSQPLASGQPSGSDINFSHALCEKIVAPLEAEFQAYWGSNDPDEVISTLEVMGIIPQRSTAKSKVIRTFRSLIPIRASKKRAANFIRNQTRDASSVPTRSIFFDATDTIEQSDISGAKMFFDRFATSALPRLPPRPGANNQRIRVAVLDTGIDLGNNFISPNLKRVNCWPEKRDCHDETGHGTHVAYLLLKFAPHIDLHVHKISNSDSLEDANINAIAKAIRFSSTGENKVDIINISFGFPCYSEDLKPIKDAIRHARDSKVLIFAAAGNEGLNQDVSWPARLSTDVLRIGASNGYGGSCGFSSDNGTRGMIMTLGEGVPSCSVNSKNEQIHRNGTSFAAPIAAAIGALILQFMDSLQADNSQYPIPPDFAEIITRLRTRNGMEMVLRELCVLRRSENAYITPWHFVQKDKHTRFYAILEILRNVQE